MGAGASAAKFSDLNDEDAAVLETRYLKLKLDGVETGSNLLKLLEQEYAELAGVKAKVEAEVESKVEAAKTSTPPKRLSRIVKVVQAKKTQKPNKSLNFSAPGSKQISPQAPPADRKKTKPPVPSFGARNPLVDLGETPAPAVSLPDPPEPLPDMLSDMPAEPIKKTISFREGACRTSMRVFSPSPLDAARMRVINLMRVVSVEAWSNFMVGLDGSKSSKMAVEVCLEELMSSKDGVIALHCFDSTKQEGEEDPRFSSSVIQHDAEVTLMTRTGKGRHALKWVDKAGDSVCNTVVRVVNDLTCDREKFKTMSKYQKSMEAPSYFVTGINGRKNVGVGSLPLLAAGKLHLPNIIVKKPPVTSRGRVFVVSIKDFQEDLYDIALDLMKPGKGDRLVVLHLYAENLFQDGSHFGGGAAAATARLKKQFTDLFASDGVQGKFASVEVHGATMSAVFLEAIAKEEADYVIIQPSLKPDGSDVSFLITSREMSLKKLTAISFVAINESMVCFLVFCFVHSNNACCFHPATGQGT
jgi:hypothetical protein